MALPAPTVAFATPSATHPVAARGGTNGVRAAKPARRKNDRPRAPGWQGVGLREDGQSLYLPMKKESRGVFGESCDMA